MGGRKPSPSPSPRGDTPSRSPLIGVDELIELEDTLPSKCPYLAGREMTLSAGLSFRLSPVQFDRLLERGCRRSGVMVYQPDCPGGCFECIPIRVPVATFAPSRSQRRLLRSFDGGIDVRITRPRFDPEHLALHNRHARHIAAETTPCTPTQYNLAFVETCVTTHFVEYFIDDQLAGISVVDEGDRSLSSVYFCWEPAFAQYSLGTYSALWEMRWGKQRGKSHYYLGYWVRDCRSMTYKNRFRPYELMDWQSGRWQRGEDGDSAAGSDQ